MKIFNDTEASGFFSAESHQYYMNLALKEAEKAYDDKEVPVGAVIIHEGSVIGKGYNQVETLKDPTAHAEILAITAAASYLNSKWLHDAELYVTKEPCAMCAGAIIHARIKNLIFGASDTKAGACGTALNVIHDPHLNHRIQVISGVEESQCSSLLTSFFEQFRKKNLG
jgi:tRNA(adenine34) deaminase